MNFSLKKITNYCELHTSSTDSVLEELERETHLKTLAPQMLAGKSQGKLLEMFSYMLNPEYILEIGSFTGYGALCLAKGLRSNGKLITIESNYELENIIKKYIQKAALEDKVELIIGNALELIPKLDYEFDLIYIDAGKQDYLEYFDLALTKLSKKGFIIADNVLWSGKVVMDKKDEDAKILDEFNKKVNSDQRVENIIVPIRDGLNIIRKI